MRVAKDGKLIGTHNDGTVKKAGVGIYEITFNTGPTGSKIPLDLENCAIFATTRVESGVDAGGGRRGRRTSSASAARGSSSRRRGWSRSATTRSRRS